MSTRIGLSAAVLTLALANPVAAGLQPAPINKCGEIDRAGSYRLTKNLRARGDCIVVTVDFVTIDLGGFTLLGPGADAADGEAISGPRGIVVRNGTITNFVEGIRLGPAAVVESVRLIDNDIGASVGRGSTVIGNTASENNFPIITEEHSTVRNNTVFSNTEALTTGRGSTITNNTSSGNGEAGFSIADDSTVIGNTANSNGNFGFRIGAASTVIGNTASSNSDGGMTVQSGSTVVNNTVTNNTSDGMLITCPSNVIGNTVIGNGDSNLSLSSGECNVVDNLSP